IVLAVYPAPHSLTISNLKALIRSRLKQWLPADDQLHIAQVTYNGSNFTGASEDMVGEDGQLGCFAHTLQLCVQDATGKDGDAASCKSDITAVRALVKFIEGHGALSRKLEERLRTSGPHFR